jgi:hypothetical protein
VGSPVGVDGEQHHDRDWHPRGETVGEERLTQGWPAAVGYGRPHDADDEEHAELRVLVALQDGSRREPAHDGEGDSRHGVADGLARGRRRGDPRELHGEVDPEDGYEPDDADERARAPRRAREEPGRPALELAHESQERDRERDDRRSENERLDGQGTRAF